MSFKSKLFQISIISAAAVFCGGVVNAAEWKSEPSVFMKTQYNDNVRMRADTSNPEASTGYTLEPRIKFAGEELQRWDMAIDARGKITRYQDIEDADSDNIFFVFDGGKKTELTDWRLNTNYSRNTNFDTDFDTQTPDAGLGDRTERITASVSPSVQWKTSETSQISFSLKSTQVKYEKVTNLNYRDYDNSSAEFKAFWRLKENHQLGFTSSYSEYDSPDINYSYNQTVLQLDYTYNINPLSDISISLGGRNLDSLRTTVTTSCDLDASLGGGSFPPANGQCPDSPLVTPVIEDVSTQNKGTVTNISYTRKTEITSHQFTGGRSVYPSSLGGANEIRTATYQFSMKNTEKFSTSLLLNASDSETVSGTASSRLNDRTQYRFEPSVSYKLSKNWKLEFLYRYLTQDYTNRDNAGEAKSNLVYVNLYLHWPKFVTTY